MNFKFKNLNHYHDMNVLNCPFLGFPESLFNKLLSFFPNKKQFFLFLTGFLLLNVVKAQVSVSPLTGAANVNIPIYTITSGQVAVPVSLSYNGSGVKTKNVESSAGMGWQLNVGGQIARVVKGLPDDVNKDNSGNQRLGWMSPLDTAANNIAGFTIANTGSGNCTNETTDITNITAKFPYRNDTEPDKFYVSAPGLSCQLVYDRVSGKFKPINYQDLVITYLTNPVSHIITSFTITNDQGITYLFGDDVDAYFANNKVTRTTIGGASANYFKNQYLQYQNGITYYDRWSLINITDANSNSIHLYYTTPAPSKPTTDSVVVFAPGATVGTLQYRISEVNTPYILDYIQAHNAYGDSPVQLSFNWGGSYSGQNIINSIKLDNGVQAARNFSFTYSSVSSPTGFRRSFLRGFGEAGCSSPISYKFAYAGENAAGTTTVLPDSTSNRFDYWGYYSIMPLNNLSRVPSVYVNPSTAAYPRYRVKASASVGSAYTYTLSGVDRLTDAGNIAVGSLIKLTTAEGANTNIIYESNDYYDPSSGSNVQGGGIRVKQLIDSVGYHSANNIIRNYTYVTAGHSSGKPLSLPQYAFTTPYSGSNTGLALWTSTTVLSAHDLSDDDHSIMYEYSTVSQTGVGSTVYRYSVPGTYFDAGAAPVCSGCTTTEWLPTVNNMARASCSIAYGPINSDEYAYPFISNPNYNFEQGLPLSSVSYNADATPKKVSETYYTYQRAFTPTAISAFKTEDNTNGTLVAKMYNKYTVYYTTGELTTKVLTKTYDSPTLSQARADSVMYTYGSANHKLLTQQQTFNSDGSVTTAKVSYTKDYAATGTNPNILAIYNLQQQNINIPVESYQQVTRAGVTKTTAASLTLFKGVTPGTTTFYLPQRQYKMIQPDGLTGFVPMSIAGSALTFDSTHYVRTANYTSYDKTGFALTADDNFKHVGTTLIDHFAGPVASFSNAAYGEVAYASFDSDQPAPAYGFTITGTGSYSPVGSHAGNAAGLAASTQTATSGNMTKNAIAPNYIFSVWINASSAGTLTLTLSGLGTHPTIAYTVGGWKYYEVKIGKGTLSATYTVSFMASSNIGVDDILFYPDVAQASTVTYDQLTHYKLATTNTNGVSAYYINDTWGRPLYTLDQDKNIVQKNTIITAADANAHYTYSPVTIGNTSVGNTTPVSFSIDHSDPCAAAGTTVSWDFGDGTRLTSAGLVSPTHTYFGSGTHTLRDTVHTLLYGDFVPPPKTITVSPIMVSLSYSNFTAGNGNITQVTFTPVGAGTSYTFTGANLQGGQVIQGTYTIIVTLTGGTQFNAGTGLGYTSVMSS